MFFHRADADSHATRCLGVAVAVQLVQLKGLAGLFRQLLNRFDQGAQPLAS